MLSKFQRNISVFSFLLAALLAVQPEPSLAQRYHIQNFHEQDGVAANTVYNAAQDSQGNMWFATRNGLSVYNSINWQEISTEDPAAPKGEGLVTIDDSGVVWWVSRRLPLKVSRLVSGHWQKLPDSATLNRFSEVIDLTTWVDSKGMAILAVVANNGNLHIWKNEAWVYPTFGKPFSTPHSLAVVDSLLLITTSSELLALDLNSLQEANPPDLELPPGRIYGVNSDPSSGIMWVIGDQWLARFRNGKLEDSFPVPGLLSDKLKPGISVCQGPDGGVYFVDYSRIQHFHPKWGLETITPANGVITDSGNHVLMDREKNIWLCSSRGISKIMSRRLACFNTDHGLLGDEVSAIIQRASGTMVLGHRKGLTFFDPEPRSLSFGHGPLVYSRVTDLAEDSEGRLWIAANYQGLGLLKDDDSIQWFGKEEGLGFPVYSVLPHPEHGLFAGTSFGLFRQVESRFEKIQLPGIDKAKNVAIRRLVPLSTGGFAIATRFFGIFFWLDGIITAVPGDELLDSNNTYAVFEHPDGRFWVGTISGLFLVEDGKLVRTTAPDPEIRRPVYGITQDEMNRFWFGTDDGATIWDGNTLTRISAQEGLLGSETNRDALMCDKKGHVWIGTDSGVSVFRPEFDTPRTVAPILRLVSMMINGKEYPLDKPLHINGPLASLVFLFNAPHFSSEKLLIFTARTTNKSEIEPPLHIISKPGILPMTNVPPGQFQIEIVGRTPYGLETNIITTPLIHIIPPLKDRWYFRVLMTVALALLMWLVFAFFSGRRYSRRLEEEVQVQTRDLRKSEETARQESERLTRTLESISDGVVVVDGQNRIVLFNRAAEAIFAGSKPLHKGCSLEDLLPVKAICHAKQAGQYEQLLKNPFGIRLMSKQVAICAANNKTCWLEISAVPITGSPGGLVFAFRDITSRRQAEQNERRSQKLESLGLLAGGIAHDFNNLLTIMMGNLSLVKNTLIATPAENEQLETVRIASKRAQILTRQLLTFAKGGKPVRETTNLIPLIQDSVSLNLSGSNVDCHLDLPGDLDWAKVEADQISQVIGNLVINARQAMSNGGKLNISAKNSDSWPGLPTDKKYVVLEIEDQGVGISENDQTCIFDPYFTTKKRGTGLGLAIAYSIAKKHDGKLTVESTPGQGSTFHLVLPACDPAPEAQKSKTLSDSFPPPTDLRILFMDDEIDIRLLLLEMLEQLHHQGVGVSNGESALDAYTKAAEDGHSFDLVLLDLTIPGGMGGLETVAELQKIDPHVKVIAVSGYSEDPVMANFRSYGFSGILNKPFSKEDLRLVIGEMVGS